MKTKFLSEFNIVRMSKNSMVLESNKTNQYVYITRNIFNKIMNNDSRIVDYTIVETEQGSLWIEILTWTRF
jgi:hypothetical protein